MIVVWIIEKIKRVVTKLRKYMGDGMTEIELTLNSPITEEQWDAITDVDFDCTSRIWFHTKHGKQVEFIKEKPVTTNADRIRAMSDEDLAEWIEFVSNGCDYMFPDCPAHDSCKLVCDQNDSCRKGWLDWLKREVDE